MSLDLFGPAAVLPGSAAIIYILQKCEKPTLAHFLAFASSGSVRSVRLKNKIGQQETRGGR